MIALGAKVINNSALTLNETSAIIVTEVQRQLAEREAHRVIAKQKPRW